MKVKLLHHSPLWLASHAIRFSHDNHDKSDTILWWVSDEDGQCYKELQAGEKDKALIARVSNKMKHSSTIEFLTYTFDVEMSTKTLLAFSRHRVGISLTMRSTRYTTTKNKGKHEVQSTVLTAPFLNRIMAIVDEAIETGMSSDEASLLLPQAYIYRGQIQFNGRSLQHFLELRTTREAHSQIRLLARAIFDALPTEHSYLFKEYMKDNV